MNILKMISNTFSSHKVGCGDGSPVNLDMFMVNETNNMGVGGFGTVCSAMFVKNHVWYAIKDINKANIMKHKNGVDMVYAELDAFKRLEHPFIVALHFSFQNRYSCFYVLDLRTGGDLRYYLKRKHIFEEKDCAFYLACLSSALMHIHSKNIIHRDIKPENILLDESGFPHIIDFGVSHVHTHDENGYWDPTLTSTLASGTKQYLAPEVFCKTHVHGPESDFWALGVVIYELLYGRRPFDKHAPINMISYLDKALAAKKNRDREMKLKVGSANGLSSLDVNPVLYSSKSLHHSGSSSISNSSSNSLPSYHAHGDHNGTTPSHSHSHAAGEHFITSHQDGSQSHAYCSSVGYSHASTQSAGHAGGGISGHHSRPGSASGLHGGGSTSVPHSPMAVQQHVPPVSPGGGGSSSGSSSSAAMHGGAHIHHQSNPAFPKMSEFENGAEEEEDDEDDDKEALARAEAAKARVAAAAEFATGVYRPAKRNTGQILHHADDSSGDHSTPALPPLSVSASGAQSPKSRPMSANNGSALNSARGGGNGASSSSFESTNLPVIDTRSPSSVSQQGLFVDNGHQQQQQLDPDSSAHTTSCSDSTTTGTTCPAVHGVDLQTVPGDHWLVDYGDLPKAYVVQMPTGTAWLGSISPHCLAMLGGLFEMRPSHRLGCGVHKSELQHHSWLNLYGYNDWDNLHHQRILPNFRPGKGFMKATFDVDGDNSNVDSRKPYPSGAGELPPISQEEQEKFKTFDFARPLYSEMLLPIQDSLSPVHEQRSISKMFSSNIAKTLGKSPKAAATVTVK